jgi:PAS domain S-box-containing protein
VGAASKKSEPGQSRDPCGIDWRELSHSEHFVQFYETDQALLSSLSNFVAIGLDADQACIIVATAAHREGLEAQLRADGYDITAARSRGQYVELDAAETLAIIAVDGKVDPDRFNEVVGGQVRRSLQQQKGVRAFGEMVALLWAAQNYEAAIGLERLWNKLLAKTEFPLLCAYPIEIFGGEELARPLMELCGEHSRVIPTESYTALSTPEERLRSVLFLQQKARSLHCEIKERKQIEERLSVSELLYRRHFEAAGDGLLIVDPKTQTITDANPSIAELLERSRDQLLGKELWEVGLFEDRESNRKAFSELNDVDVVRYENLALELAAGTSCFVDVVCNMYSTEGHSVIQCNVRNVTERKRSDEIASHLAAIVRSSDDAIVSKSLDGIIQSWNKGAERIFGYTEQEAIGQSINMLIPPERVDEEPAILAKLKAGEYIDHYETVRVTKDGRRLYVSLCISPVKDSSGVIIGASKIARDITDRKRAEAERENLLVREQMARAEAQNANRMKDEFLATVSHELRTPLNAIIGWSHMLRTNRVDEKTAARAIETIERSAKSQAQLIEDILDVSRAITGKLRLNILSVDVAAVINATIDSVQLAADSKSIRLEVILEPSVRRISGDATRLQQVVWNLLSNAIKFTPAGGRIEVRLERAGAYLQIKVCDTGQGIKPEFLPFLFDRFRQADASSTRKQGGLGLGLAIVRNLVELHGGTVRADSPGEGGGATFTVSLPLGVGADRATGSLITEPLEVAGPARNLKPAPSLDGIKVLLVDDDYDTLHLLTVMLSDQRAMVQGAASAAEALDILQWFRPDVLVSDLAMPNEDGYSLIDKVRGSEGAGGKQIPAVALTAYVRVEDRSRALSAGFNMFVPKPVEVNELIAAIANLAESDRVGLAKA